MPKQFFLCKISGISFLILVLYILLCGICAAAHPENVSDLRSQFTYNGLLIDERLIGPGLPPEGWVMNANLPNFSDPSTKVLNPAQVPALSWSYGCSATSAAMYFGYYDRNGYPNMYTGPTGGGVFPLNNAMWGSSFEGNGECPLSASHKGIDGRITRGNVDDYYYKYDSAIDPYHGNWAEHTPPDCTADFMGTNQYYNWFNTDGSTRFFFATDGSPLHDFTGRESDHLRDGIHGMKLFAQSRGYSVATNYNQYIYGYRGNTQGFTYDQYKAEIDAGYPVLIQVEGHTMLGVGYTGTDQIIVHDTWDYTKHTMTWGGMYANMRHYGVGVFHLNPPPAPTPTPTPTPVPAPVVTSITPDSGQIGTRVLYTLTGSHFAAGARVNLSKTGERNISDMPTLVGTNLTGVFAIPEDATLGQWNVTVQQNGQYSNDDVIFTITPPPVPVPEVFEVSPESGQAGLCVPYVVTGSGFVDGAFVHLTREGEVNITSSARLDGGKLNGTFKIPLSARNGPWHVLVEQDGHLSNDDVFFTITSAPLDIPIITSFMPFTGYRGEIITYTITGSHLLNGAIVNITHPGEPNISSIAMLDGDVLTGTFIIPVDARAGSWNVSVNQNGYLSADAIPFIITEGPTIAPVVHNITPPSGIQGDMINYLIQGEYFMDGAKVVFSHPDQAVISSSADLTDGNLTGTVHIPDDAFPGAWNVTIHQGNLSSNDDVQFLILPSGPYPVVHSITMSFAALGKGTGFIVFGENFEDGAIVNLSHPKEKNITAIGSLVDGTLTGTFHIPEYCSSGLWNVTVNVQGRISNDEVQYPIKGKTQ